MRIISGAVPGASRLAGLQVELSKKARQRLKWFDYYNSHNRNARFTEFIKKLIDSAFVKDSELRVIDTICHDTRKRQAASLQLASRVDLMLVIGGHTSANTNRLAELCSPVTKTYLIETADEIQSSWLQGQYHYIGITAGASTALETINEVLIRLETIAQP